MNAARRRWLAGMLSVAAGPVVAAEATQPLRTELVRNGLYLIRGGGGHSLLRFSPAGAILVDSKQADAYPSLRAELRKLSRLTDLPLRVLVLTGPAQAGNLARFADAGVATVLQANLLPPPSVTPTRTYRRDYLLRMGGVEVRLLHPGDDRAGADSVVHFPDLKVVAVGDLYAPDLPPGTTAADRAAALAEVLTLDIDTVVPSHGPVLSRADLVALKTRFEARSDAAACRAPGCS